MGVSLIEQAEQIFYQAQQMSKRERPAFVNKACSGDLPLQTAVERLLAGAEQSEDYFRDLEKRIGIATLMSDIDASPWGEARPDQQVGQYTLIKQVGVGGMGAVWLARRSDGHFEGEVAIKLLNLASGSAAMRRFALEAQTLAKLTHPNIARLLDAGVGGNQQPYIVLEFVDGVPIDQYCDNERIDVKGRIRLFCDVLAAVGHAHAHLIVHRDIKPSNVLVTADGTAKLLDFGVAKMLRGDEVSRNLTQELGTALTPEFAAPEQFLGQQITTATDVYDLGLLLYVLVTGHHPRPLNETKSFAELQNAILRDPPNLWKHFKKNDRVGKQASRVAINRGMSLGSLERSIRSDLDSIVRKALAVEPKERYATALGFAADLGRFLRDEPVAAQADTIRYRTHKFVRRHKASVAAAMITAISLLIATVVSVTQNLEARRQRDAAIDQQQRVQASNEFLTHLLEEIGPTGGALTSVQLLDRSVELLNQYDSEQPFIGRLLYNVSQRYSALGATDRALTLLGRAEILARDQEDMDLLAAVLCTMAQNQYLSAPQVAIDRISGARLILEGSETPSTDSYVACTRADAMLLEMQGHRKAAIGLLSDTRKSLAQSRISSTYLDSVLMRDLSGLYFRLDRFDKVQQLSDEQLRVSIESGREDTFSHMIILIDRAAMLHQMGEIAAGFDLRQQAVERVRELEKVGEIPIHFWHGYAGSLRRLARYDEALTIYLENREKADSLGNIFDRARSDMQMGRMLVTMGRFGEAEQCLDNAESVYRDNSGFSNRHLQLISLARAQIQLGEGDLPGSQRSVDDLLDDLGYPNDKSAPGLKYALTVATTIALARGEMKAAEAMADTALTMAIDIARDQKMSADVGHVRLLRAKARLALGKRELARSDVVAAVDSLRNGFGGDHPITLEALSLEQRLH